MKTRKIIHLDLDAFFCAVEEQLDPLLIGLPFAVGGRPDERGVVSSCSYAARAHGVHSAMPMAQALRQCPQLKIVSSHFLAYRQASRQVMAQLHKLTPLVEQLSIDEAFLDVSDLTEDAAALGRNLQMEIWETLGLPCSLGIASNKLVAKIANDVGKGMAQGGVPPRALTLVPAGSEAEFMAPLPVKMLWGVGPKTAERLAPLGVQTIGDLAEMRAEELGQVFGKIGWNLAKRARGIDTRPIVTEHEAKSVSQEVTYVKDTHDETVLRKTLREHSEHISRQLKKQELTARTVKIKLRWPDFSTLTRQTTLTQPTTDAAEIHRAAEQLFNDLWSRGKDIRLLGVGVSNLEAQPRQLGLWDPDVKKNLHLRETLNNLQERFGVESIQRGIPTSDTNQRKNPTKPKHSDI